MRVVYTVCNCLTASTSLATFLFMLSFLSAWLHLSRKGISLVCLTVSLQVGGLMLLFSGASSGMFHSGVALLPSTTCMYCVMVGYTCWLNGRIKLGLLAGCFGVLLVWPIVAPMFIPMGMHALVSLSPSGFSLLSLPCLIDPSVSHSFSLSVSAYVSLVLMSAFLSFSQPLNLAASPSLTLTFLHSHTLTTTCTCCYDEIKGTKDQDFSCSFSDSLS